MSKKKVTNENIAQMIKVGFDEVSTKLVEHDKRFDKMDKRLNSLEQGQEDIILRLDNKADKFEVNEIKKHLKI